MRAIGARTERIGVGRMGVKNSAPKPPIIPDIHLHIEKVVVEGVATMGFGRAELQHHLQQELLTLLRDATPEVKGDISFRVLPVMETNLSNPLNMKGLAAESARAIHTAMNAAISGESITNA
jgi:hypothetical protein